MTVSLAGSSFTAAVTSLAEFYDTTGQDHTVGLEALANLGLTEGLWSRTKSVIWGRSHPVGGIALGTMSHSRRLV